jgi:hypothetical protein
MGDAGALLTRPALPGSTSVKQRLWGTLLKPPDDEKKAPAEARHLGGSDRNHRSPPDSKRNRRRQYLSAQIHAAGPRPVLEALIAVHEGANLDDVLADFARIPPEVYHAMGASHFQEPVLIIGSSSTWLLQKH